MVESLLHCHRYCIQFVLHQVEDVTPEDAVISSRGVANHPAWTLGHLAVCIEAVVVFAGGSAWSSPEWRTLFQTGSQPTSSPGHYPSLSHLSDELLRSSHEAGLQIEQLAREQLESAVENLSYREHLPTLQIALNQMLVGHTAYHSGQLAIWRSAMGYPASASDFL